MLKKVDTYVWTDSKVQGKRTGHFFFFSALFFFLLWSVRTMTDKGGESDQSCKRMPIPNLSKPGGAHSEVGVVCPAPEIQFDWVSAAPPSPWLVSSQCCGAGKGRDEGQWSCGVAKKERQSRSAQAQEVRHQEGAWESERECGTPDALVSASWVASLDACAVALRAPRAAGGCPARLRSRRRRQGEVEAVERQRQQRVPGLRQQRGRRRAEAEVTKAAAAAAAVSLTVAETKAAAADGERPGPGPLLVGCGRAAVGPARLPPPAAPPPAPPPGRRRGAGPARTQTAAAAAAGGVGSGGGAMGGLASGGDVEPGLPVEVRGSNGAFYKVRRRADQGLVFSSLPPAIAGKSGVGSSFWS